jgi:hypothetical protein
MKPKHDVHHDPLDPEFGDLCARAREGRPLSKPLSMRGDGVSLVPKRTPRGVKKSGGKSAVKSAQKVLSAPKRAPREVENMRG